MADNIPLIVEVQTKGVKQAASDLQALEKAASSAEKSTGGMSSGVNAVNAQLAAMGAKAKGAGNSFRDLDPAAAAMAKLGKESKVASDGIKSATNQLDKFNKEAKSSEGSTKGISGAIGSLSKFTGGFAIAAAGLAGSFAIAIKDSIKFAASLDDMAERTGSTVENLSRLSEVAKIGGHDMGEVEQSVIKLNKALHGSDDESKGAAKALAALGLSVDDLKSKDPADAMLEVATALEKFADGGGKSAVAMALLGKSGAQALPFLKDLADQGEQVVKITSEQAAQAEQYEKNMARLGVAISSTSRTMALEFLPVLSRMSGELAAATQASGGFFNYLKTAATVNPFKTVEENIKSIGAEAASLEDKISIGRGSKKDEEQLVKLNGQLKLLRAIDDVRTKQLADGIGLGDIEKKPSLDTFYSSKEPKPKKAPRGGKTAAAQASEEAKAYEDAMKGLASVNANAQKSTLELSAAQSTLYDLMTSPAWATMPEAWKQTAVAQFESARAAEMQAEKFREHAKAMEEGKKVMESMRTPEEALAAEIVKLNSLLDQGAIEWEVYARAVFAAQDKLDGTAKKVEETSNEMDEFAKSAAKNIQSSLADFLFDPFKEGLDGMLKGFAKMLQRMIAEAAAAQIATALFGDMKSGKVGGLVGSIPWERMISSIIGAKDGHAFDNGQVKKFASGGVFGNGRILTKPTMFALGGTLGVAGEAGPEGALPLKRMSNGKLGVYMSGGGGTTINQTINAGSGTDKAEIKRAAASGARTALGVMSGARRYG